MTIITRSDIQKDIKLILDITRQKDVERIIIGLPVSMDGSIGKQADKVREFTEELRKQTNVPVEFRDERLSTVSAKRMVQTARKTDKTTRYDAAAAALILQSYLDGESQKRESADNFDM